MKTSNPILSSILKYLGKLTDGLGVTNFYIYPGVEYGSEKHIQICERMISKIEPLIDDNVDEAHPRQPYIARSVVQKIRTRMDRTYHAGRPFKPSDVGDIAFKELEEVCGLIESSGHLAEYKDTAVVKRESILGFPAYTKSMEEKWAWIRLAAIFVSQGFLKCRLVKFRAIFTVFFRRQWKSVSNKNIQTEAGLVEVDRSLSDNWIMARNRQVFGGDPVNVVVSLALQSCQHVVYDTYKEIIDISTSEDWFNMHKGYVICLDIKQFDSCFNEKMFNRIMQCVEKIVDLPGWVDYMADRRAIYKDENGKIHVTSDTSNPSGQAAVTITNFMMGLALNLYILRRIWPDFNLVDHKRFIERIINKGDDTLIAFKTQDDLDKYLSVLKQLSDDGITLFAQEVPPAMLGFLAYQPSTGEYYMDYNYTNMAAGLCQKEKQDTEYFYISWMAKQEILNRNSLGKKILKAFEETFYEIMGMSYTDHVILHMSDKEKAVLDGRDISSLKVQDLLVMIKPEMALYKYKLSEISKDVLDVYYLSLSGEEVYDLIHGDRSDYNADIDDKSIAFINDLPDLEVIVDMYNKKGKDKSKSREVNDEDNSDRGTRNE